MVAISQPWPSTSTEVGIPSARPCFSGPETPWLSASLKKPSWVRLAVFQEFLRGFSGSRVSILTATTSNFGAAELGLQAVQRRHFLAAGHAPGRPQVHQHRASAPVRQLSGLAVAVLEGQIRQLQRRGRHGQCRDFAMRQRRDLARKVDRPGAGGIARPPPCVRGRQTRIPRQIQSPPRPGPPRSP